MDDGFFSNLEIEWRNWLCLAAVGGCSFLPALQRRTKKSEDGKHDEEASSTY